MWSFNPRTHVGCDKIGALFGTESKFQSTHPRRVRQTVFSFKVRNYLFQSTHPRRVRLFGADTYEDFVGFNPRTHVGCDGRIKRKIKNRRSFNPRTHVGCDCLANRQHHLQPCFNPRTHVGCDSLYSLYFAELPCFNPRTHVGCDRIPVLLQCSTIVSIHAPT